VRLPVGMRRARVPLGSGVSGFVCAYQVCSVSIGQSAGGLDGHGVAASVKYAVESRAFADMGVAAGATGDDECAAEALVAPRAVGRGGDGVPLK
jgi:hypothetical protein